VLIAAVIAFAFGKAAEDKSDPGSPIYRRVGKGLLHTVAWQFVLGWAAYWAFSLPNSTESVYRMVIGTLHQFNGAVLMALVVMALVWTRRLIAPAGAAVQAA
jgi:hypothetical protein